MEVPSAVHSWPPNSLPSLPGGVVSQLAKKRSNCEEKIKTLSANKDYLEKSLKESENSLRELIVQKKNTA